LIALAIACRFTPPSLHPRNWLGRLQEDPAASTTKLAGSLSGQLTSKAGHPPWAGCCLAWFLSAYRTKITPSKRFGATKHSKKPPRHDNQPHLAARRGGWSGRERGSLERVALRGYSVRLKRELCCTASGLSCITYMMHWDT